MIWWQILLIAWAATIILTFLIDIVVLIHTTKRVMNEMDMMQLLKRKDEFEKYRSGWRTLLHIFCPIYNIVNAVILGWTADKEIDELFEELRSAKTVDEIVEERKRRK